jgi:hypothetical protein
MQQIQSATTIATDRKAPVKQNDQLALITLSQVIDKAFEWDFENASHCLEGLADLVQHHPSFQKEVAAMRAVAKSRDLLVATTWKAHNL